MGPMAVDLQAWEGKVSENIVTYYLLSNYSMFVYMDRFLYACI